jgi:translation initiation factor IF-2
MQVEGQRVHELADELGYNKQELVTRINDLDLGFTVNNFMTRLNENEVKQLKEALDQPEQAEVEEAVEADSDDDGIGPTVIRRNKSEPEEAETDDEGPATGEAVDQTEAETDAADVGGVVRRRSEDEDEEEAEATEQVEAEADEPEAAAESDAEEELEEEAPEAETVEAEQEDEAAQQAEPAEVEAEAEQAEAETEDEEEPEVAEATEESEETADQQEAEAGEEAADEQADEADLEAEAEEEQQDQDDQEHEAAAEETQTEPPEADEPAEKSEEESSEEQEKEDDGPPPKVAKKVGREEEDGAEVTGRINQDVIKDRLAAEGKDFGPKDDKKDEKKEKKEEKDKGSKQRSRHRTRQVVEGQDLYEDGRSSRRQRKKDKQKPQKTEITEAAEHKRVIEMEDVITVGDLAEEMGIKAGEVAMTLMESGMNATVNTTLDYETATLVADEYGYTVENVAFDISDFYDTSPDEDAELELRPPVVTVMGHVDHGKTTLLDSIRESDVQGEETGGITQHIGAYQVDTGESRVTFLDTPGHEAFTALRARGAKATDIVVLVVAADDGVMPQTVEAINHAQDADVPIVVAINKIDKPTANPDRIKQALTEYELIPEEWGGTTLYVDVSAKENTNITDLLESLQLQAEIEEFRANPDRNAQGLVIESELDTGRGPVATALVQRGTLHDGDIIVSGQYHGSIRTMRDDRARAVEEAGPSQPVEITGLDGVPDAGEPFFVVDSESDAQRITEHVEEQRRKEQMADRAKEVTGDLEDLSAMIQEGEVKELKVIIKGDVQGSVEALKEAFNNLGNDEVRVDVIHSGVGSVTENDVNLAASSETAAIIVGFNVRPDSRAQEIAEEHDVQILTHSVIYDAIDQVKNLLEGLLEPIVEERVRGRVEVRDLFSSGAAGTIAGCYVIDGSVNRNHRARVIRNGQIIAEADIASLRRYEEDVKEVREGYECGISLQGVNDIELEDEIEFFEHVEVSATLS